MQRLSIVMLVLTAYSITSCSVYFNAYVRNPTNKTAVVDVYLLQKQNMKTLPNQVKTANRIIAFKGAYRQQFDSLQTVTWVSTEHFRLKVAPHTTTDLTDMAGSFLNGSVMQDVLVTVTASGKTDTLLNGQGRPVPGAFVYKGMGFKNPVIYHDIR